MSHNSGCVYWTVTLSAVSTIVHYVITLMFVDLLCNTDYRYKNKKLSYRWQTARRV